MFFKVRHAVGWNNNNNNGNYTIILVLIVLRGFPAFVT